MFIISPKNKNPKVALSPLLGYLTIALAACMSVSAHASGWTQYNPQGAWSSRSDTDYNGAESATVASASILGNMGIADVVSAVLSNPDAPNGEILCMGGAGATGDYIYENSEGYPTLPQSGISEIGISVFSAVVTSQSFANSSASLALYGGADAITAEGTGTNTITTPPFPAFSAGDAWGQPNSAIAGFMSLTPSSQAGDDFPDVSGNISETRTRVINWTSGWAVDIDLSASNISLSESREAAQYEYYLVTGNNPYSPILTPTASVSLSGPSGNGEVLGRVEGRGAYFTGAFGGTASWQVNY